MAKFDEAINKANQSIDSLVGSLERLDTKIIETSNLAAQQLGNVSKIISPNEMNAQLQKQQALIDNLNKELAEQKALLEKLTVVKRNQSKATAEEIVGQRELKKNADLQAKATIKIVGAYQNLIAKQRQAKATLQNLIVSEKANTREIKRAQREYNKYTARVNKARKATSNFAKTGLGSAVRGFKNLLGAFGIIGGVMAIATLVKSVFNLTKTLNSMDFAMKAVIKDQFEFAQTEIWLSEITQAFGAELVTTTNRYIKFRAASIQAGLSAKETQDIFGTMTKAAGVLGLKTDELTGIYLALEQMISKGKITTEELRRQLGERLPGAMDIMAKAVGVTTSELDGMMKKGLLITKEVLPAFAKQVEKSFGIENVKKVETLQAEVSRLSNEWTLLIKNIEGSEGALSKAFSSAVKSVSGFISIVSDLNKVTEKTGEGFFKVFMKAFLSPEFEEAIKRQADEIREQEKRALIINEIIKLTESQNNVEFTRIQRLQEGSKWNKLSTEALEKVLDARKKLEQIESESDKKGRSRLEFLKGSIASLKEIIRLNTDRITLELQNKDDPERKRLIKLNEELKKQVDWMEKIVKLQGASTVDGGEFIPGLTPTLVKLARVKTLGEELLTVFEGLTSTFSDVFDIDMSKFEFLLDENINSVEEWTDASKELIGSVLDASLRRYELELMEAERTRDLILENEHASEEQKEAARARFDAEERRIRTEAAKKERDNTLIKIAVDTAAAIVKVTAQTGVLAPFAIPAIVAIGLAQAAFVAAQPLPKFEGGTMNAPEGWALTQEKRPEPITDKFNRLVTMGSSGGPMLTPLGKGYKVYPSEDEFFRNNNQDAIQRAVWNMNIASNGEELSKRFVDNSLLNETKGLRKDIDKMGRSIKKMASRPINNNVTVEIEDKRPY